MAQKPLIHSESSIVSMEHSTPPEPKTQFEFGHPPIDNQFPNGISPETFICLSGPIGCGKSSLSRQFILDGVSKSATMHATIF